MQLDTSNAKFLAGHGYYVMPDTGPAPAYQAKWLRHYGVTVEEACSKLRIDGVMSATTPEGRERVWRAACRRAMRQKKKEAALATS